MTSSLLSAFGLLILAVMHSVLGERRILIPLLAEHWEVALPRPAAARIIRFAWHLTSLFWVALAAVVVGIEPGLAVGVVCLVSAIVLLGALRTHPAWPVFLFAGLAGLDAANALPMWVRTTGGMLATAGLVAAAALHWYWVIGGRWLIDRAVPTRPAPTSTGPAGRTGPGPWIPGRWLTALVAVALMVLAFAIGSSTGGLNLPIVRLIGWIGVCVFVLRIVGDGHLVGFTKRVRSTPFARADDLVFTPVMVLLAFGSSGGLLTMV